MSKDIYVVSMKYKHDGDYNPIAAYFTEKEAQDYIFECQRIDEADGLTAWQYKITNVNLYE